ncbi:MAG: PIN domain-containing protein [Candidatus Heimdallarchaeota archaeon]|nr:PIN domain-containing protein [Candidatus Heimdallarchaeota archaeon]
MAKSATYKITVEKFLEHSIIVPVSSEIVQKASKIQAEQMRKGERLPVMDLQIGTTAIINKAPLITKDKHFEKMIPWNLEIIQS